MFSSPTLRSAVLAGACVVAVSVAGTAPAQAATNRQVHMAENLSAADSGSTAVTYDPQLAPLGAHLAVDVVDAGEGDTHVALDAAGLLPDHGYMAHAHVDPCGATGADAGGHFQNAVDPAAGPGRPSTDPAFANPKNEVWLDLHTDADGNAHAEADVPFTFETRRPRSVVVHDAGAAGDRVACFTLPD